MYSAKESLDDNKMNQNGQDYYQNEKSNTEILLNSFLLRKKRYRVLLHLDKIIWEQEDRPNYKSEVSVFDIISISKSTNAKNKLPSTPRDSTMSTFSNLQTINQTTSTSSTYLYPSNSSIEQLTIPTSTFQQNDFSNLGFQSNDESTNYYQNDELNNSIPQQLTTTSSTTTPTDNNKNLNDNNLYLIINYGKRLTKSEKQYNQWRKKTIIFYNSDPIIIDKWYSVLNQILIQQKRPKNLLIFINPYGGHKKGLKIYEKYCKPLFQSANIECNCIISQRANQIRDIIMKQSLEQYDGICCVGGDGTFAEVFNGLIFRAITDLNLNPLKPNYIPKPMIPIGIIPAGSTDTIVYCLHGTSDITTATIHIILGQKRGLDLSSVKNANGLIRFYASVLSYGYLGDIALDSEKFRWMGPKRYEYSGFKKFFANRGYDGEILLLDTESSNQLPSASSSNLSDNVQATTEVDSKIAQFSNTNLENANLNNSNSNLLNEKCYINCLHCSKNENLNLIENNKNLNKDDIIYNNNDNYDNSTDADKNQKVLNTASTSSTISLEIKSKDMMNDDTENKEIETTIDCDKKIVNNKNDKLNCNDAVDMKMAQTITSETSNNWKNIKGKFFLISGANISCACARSPNGISPYSHLGDGYLNIILVKHTTFFNNLRLLLQMSNKNGDLSKLPFVEIHRAKKFLFRAQKSTTSSSSSSSSNCPNPIEFTSQWNCDGEVIQESDIVITSHRQLIDTFMRGPYPIDDSTTSSKCCGKF